MCGIMVDSFHCTLYKLNKTADNTNIVHSTHMYRCITQHYVLTFSGGIPCSLHLTAYAQENKCHKQFMTHQSYFTSAS